MVSRRDIKYWIDVGLFISGFLCILTGIIKFPGVVQFLEIRSLLPVYQITLIHDWSGVILAILILFHVALNWRWMVTVTRSLLQKGPKTGEKD